MDINMITNREETHAVSTWWNLAVRETLQFGHSGRKANKNSKNGKIITRGTIEPGKQIAAIVTGKIALGGDYDC